MVPKLLLSAAVLAVAGLLAWTHFRGSEDAASRRHPLAGDRPWRKVGAALCVLISVMFVLGIYIVDIPDRPVPYALYWIIMLALVVWLFVLAVRDIMYTRKLARQWRIKMRDRAGTEPRQVGGSETPAPQRGED